MGGCTGGEQKKGTNKANSVTLSQSGGGRGQAARAGGKQGGQGHEYDFLFKLLLIGDSGVGKSSLLLRFADNTFTESFISTIGVDFKIRTLEIDGATVKLQIWDTAGQERFRSVTRSYYRGAAGAILVYDITSRETYNHVTSWLSDARSLANKDIAIILVGNKADLPNREVTFLEASRFAQENDLMFLETSALSGEGVDGVFFQCARSILSKIQSGILDPESMGSGVQHGDSKTARELSRKKPEESGCAC